MSSLGYKFYRRYFRLRNKNPFTGKMVSFDISSLFTNVSLSETVEFLRTTLKDHPELLAVTHDDDARPPMAHDDPVDPLTSPLDPMTYAR